MSIEQLRKEIEQIDMSIIEKLAQREKLSKQIGQIKLQEGVTIIDVSREKKLFELYEHWCEQYQLSKEFVYNVFKLIITHSREIQR